MSEKPLFTVQINEGVPEITPEQLFSHLGQVTLIDVRRPDEYTGELSHIQGARLVTLGPDLDTFLDLHDKSDHVVFICRSGARSGRATVASRERGYTNTFNLQGGMLLWNQKQLPTVGGRS